jgi:hypothetical protein
MINPALPWSSTTKAVGCSPNERARKTSTRLRTPCAFLIVLMESLACTRPRETSVAHDTETFDAQPVGQDLYDSITGCVADCARYNECVPAWEVIQYASPSCINMLDELARCIREGGECDGARETCTQARTAFQNCTKPLQSSGGLHPISDVQCMESVDSGATVTHVSFSYFGSEVVSADCYDTSYPSVSECRCARSGAIGHEDEEFSVSVPSPICSGYLITLYETCWNWKNRVVM